MYLALKTADDQAELALVSLAGRTAAADRWEAGRQLSGQLLDHIQKLLDGQKAHWQDVRGVAVFRGPGSFTGLRIGVSVANAIAYAQSIPIVGTAGSDWVSDGTRRLQAGENDVRVTPEYGSEPRITRPGRDA